MSQDYSIEREHEITQLQARLLLILDFFENVQPFPSGSAFRSTVRQAAEAGRLRELRLIAREMETMIVALSQDQRDGLEALLKIKLGVDVEIEHGALMSEINRTLRRGVIASEKERQRVERWLDELTAIDADPSVRRALQNLLDNGLPPEDS